MKTITKVLFASLMVWAFSAVTHAGSYIGATGFNLDTEVGDFRGINLVGGIDFNEVIGVRGRYMVRSSDEVYQGTTVVSIDRMLGLDLVLTLPLSDSLSSYAVAGRTRVRVEASNHYASAAAVSTFTNYGVGLRFDVRESFSVTGEYMKMDEANMLSLGVNYTY